MNEGVGLIIIALGFFVAISVMTIFGDDTTYQMRVCVDAGYEWKSGDCVKAEK